MARLGIPRSLLYFRNQVLWPAFFEALGHEVVLSPATNRRIVDRGSSLAVDESCLPLKIFLGHVEALRDKCDIVVIGRQVSVEHVRQSMCVKYWATWDIAKNVFGEMEMLDLGRDEYAGLSERKALVRAGRELGASAWKARAAYREARRLQDEADARAEAEGLAALEGGGGKLRVLVAAHSYNLRDELIGKPVTSFLETQGVEIVYSDCFEGTRWSDLGRNASPGMYWTYNREILGSVEYCRDRVDGIVFLVTFPCGPDSLMTELCRRKIADTPVLIIVVDELQAEAGLRTRLESFVDIIRMRKQAVSSAEAEAV